VSERQYITSPVPDEHLEVQRVEAISVQDDGDLRKYRTEIPNLVDDLGLSVYAFRLYVHLKRVCGADPQGRCYQGTRTLAKRCKISMGKISEAKKELLAYKLIEIQTFPPAENRADEVRILDIWRRNFDAFAPRSSDEHPRSRTRSPHEPKKEPLEEEPFKNNKDPETTKSTKSKEEPRTASARARRRAGYEWLFE
jgi:hypothetical protein